MQKSKSESCSDIKGKELIATDLIDLITCDGVEDQQNLLRVLDHGPLVGLQELQRDSLLAQLQLFVVERC